MGTGIFELAVIVIVAAGLGVIAKIFKQPAILAYLATGAILGYLKFLPLFADQSSFHLLADLGIMFLLFLIGLEINYDSLRLVGKTSLILGLSQIAVTFAGGFAIAALFNFSYLDSAYLAIALTFSSTIIVVNLLTEKKDLNSLYGKISVGFLLVQDFVAILLLILLTGIRTGDSSWPAAASVALLRGIALFAAMLWLGRKILPFVLDRIARSRELLFLVSLAWVFMLAAVVGRIGFPIEIGGFLAGLALANSSETFEIARRVRPLRDFFILIFFVILGSSAAFSNLSGLGLPVVVFSLFVLVGNPLIVMAIMGIMGYRKRTGFLVGLTVAQISEFSLVLVALGWSMGHISDRVVGLAAAVGAITITASTYLMIWSDKIYYRLEPFLSFFERKNAKDDRFVIKEYKKPLILIGAHRTGWSIADQLPKKELLVIDFDPEVAADLARCEYDYIFGDISDPEVFRKANIAEARLVISTSPDFEGNMNLLRNVRAVGNRETKLILRAESERDAEIFYGAGADYVLLPNFTAGQYLGKTMAFDPEMKILSQLKKKDLEVIRNKKCAADRVPKRMKAAGPGK